MRTATKWTPQAGGPTIPRLRCGPEPDQNKGHDKGHDGPGRAGTRQTGGSDDRMAAMRAGSGLGPGQTDGSGGSQNNEENE